ncbi:hypothetical protein [Parerythrobacter aestuarii]|uniref:hypothetical protein n=1 Tax=Parerythrobacter aestuarii TaxID=3020909 RepID=UPI0024DECD5F|nr:hypothetical protein [Parerythrobacter aestuarii]
MRALAPCLLLLAAGCEAEPDFDERYADAEQEVNAKAEELDKALQEPSMAKTEAEEDAEPR